MNQSSSESIHKRPNFDEVRFFWKSRFPIFYVIRAEFDQENSYWAEISKLAFDIVKTNEIPDPYLNFSDFVDFLTIHTGLINPITIMDMLPLIEKVCSGRNLYIILWEYAESLESPILFTELLRYILFSKSTLLNELSKDLSSIDFLFDHYYPMLENSFSLTQKVLESRVNLIDSLVRMMCLFNEKISLFDSLCSKLISRLSIMSNQSISPLNSIAFRNAVLLFKSLHQYMTPNDQANRLMQFVKRFPRNSIFHFPAVKFAQLVRPKEFGFISLCKTIIEQGIIDQNDLCLIESILSMKCIKQPIDIIKFLFETTVTHKYLAKASSKILEKIVYRFQDLSQLKQYVELFIRRSFQFIHFSGLSAKYIRKRYLVICCLHMLKSLSIPWLTLMIHSSSTSIQYNEQIMLEMEGLIFSCESQDPLLQLEIDEANVKTIDLKNFMIGVAEKIKSKEMVTASSRDDVRKPKIPNRFSRPQKVSIEVTDLSSLENIPGPEPE